MAPLDAADHGRVDRSGHADSVARGSAGAPAAHRAGVVNALSVDVEDYFQVSAFAGIVGRSDWDAMPSRVERSTDRTLELFAESGVRATFFTLGWVAERHPALIRRIVSAGHELASHGYAHYRVCDQAPEVFREDVRRTRRILEDAGGVPVIGFRAASFSISEPQLWAHRVLAEEGYRYSSSIYPVRHDHYGMPEAPRFAYRPVGEAGVVEYPVTTVRIGSYNVPCGGGGYFRLLPYAYFRWAIGRVNAVERASAIFYFHPWEVDPDQPRQSGLGFKTRFRHYVNLSRMETKLRALVGDFRWDRMDAAFDVH